MAKTYHHELRGPLPEQLGMLQQRPLPMTERTRWRASFCLTSMRNARWMASGRRRVKGAGTCASGHHHTEGTSRSREVPGKLGLASYVAFMASWDLLKWAESANPVGGGPEEQDAVPGDPTPAPMWRRGCPTIPTSCQSLRSENAWVHEQRASSKRAEARKRRRGRGRAVWEG